MVQEVVSILL